MGDRGSGVSKSQPLGRLRQKAIKLEARCLKRTMEPHAWNPSTWEVRGRRIKSEATIMWMSFWRPAWATWIRSCLKNGLSPTGRSPCCSLLTWTSFKLRPVGRGNPCHVLPLLISLRAFSLLCHTSLQIAVREHCQTELHWCPVLCRKIWKHYESVV